MAAPRIEASTTDERRAFVQERYACIADCDACGLCVLFRQQDPQTALADYIEGREELPAVMMRYRRR